MKCTTPFVENALGFSLKILYKISKSFKFNQILAVSRVKCAESDDQRFIPKLQLEEFETVSEITST